MSIKRINTHTTQQICSSQVVVSIAAAVKELIENSLDAQSTKIEIRLKNFGADLIEVHDDGIGICSDEFNQFTLRHTTSKLESFEDLDKLESFGFRGEALNSLCFLGDVQVHTQSQSSAVGSLLKFDQFGKLTSLNQLARQRGTTVFIKNIFHSLPVRRKQFLANLKREFDKTLKYIMAYCLVCEDVSISCCKIDNSKQIILSTKGTGGIGGNIEAIFGSKQLKSMIELFTEHNVPQDILDEFNVKDICNLNKIKLSGWISRPADNLCPVNAGKQFLYVNNRPCELPKIKRLICECYRRMNKSFSPTFVIKIILPKESVDVNIEPDKRVLLLDNQPDVLAVIKASIFNCFTGCGFSQDSRLLDRSFEDSAKPFFHSVSSPNISQTPIKKSEEVVIKSKRSLSTPESFQSKILKLQSPDIRNVSADSEAPRLSQVACQIVQIPFSLSCLNSTAENPTNFDWKEKFELGSIKSVREKEGFVEKFQSNLSSNDNESAEEELKKIFRKSYFNNLEVLGQFNKGFIIARMNSDLFIIDQHASDEKKQFEMFFDQCKLTSQNLVCLQRLHVTAGDEETIKEHLEVFQKWGFRFEFKESNPLYHRVFLTAAPCRNNITLDSSDLQEMIQLIKDLGPSCSIMPSRIRVAIASNACRSAVMIGTNLTRPKMEQILKNMALLKDPWTCAHGRPTIRHLFCLNATNDCTC